MALVFILILTGCATTRSNPDSRVVRGESLVLAASEPGRLAFVPSPKYPIRVRSTYLENTPKTVHYEEGRDYSVDYERGTIERTRQSRIPDFSTNMLFRVRDFDHGKFPGFGNLAFFAYVDYTPIHIFPWPRQTSQAEFLPKTRAKLVAGESLRIVAYGDSITTGGEASEPKLIFWQRWADALQGRYPKAKIETFNGATGGDSTPQGIFRLEEKVLSQKPDVVLIGFGMNDNNVVAFGTPLDKFSDNLRTMIEKIRTRTGAEIILFSAFPPNPNWLHGSKNMNSYAAATERVARDERCAFADVYRNWLTWAAHKKPSDLLANNINHPNDFGHWIYFQVFEHLGL